MNRQIPDKAVLEHLYLHQRLPMHRVAKALDMSVGKVHRLITLYEIPARKVTSNGYHHTPETCELISKLNKGKSLSAETREKIRNARTGCYVRKTEFGGHKKQRNDGYISVYVPHHKNATKEGYVMEHILVMERHIGRLLTADEVVHHKNRVRNDNRIENLELMTKSSHASYHNRERHKKKGMMTYQ